MFGIIARYGENEHAKESCRYLAEYHRNKGDLGTSLVWMEKLFTLQKSTGVSFMIAKDYEALVDS